MLKILVVDDDFISRKVLRSALEEMNVARLVDCVSNGQEALSAFDYAHTTEKQPYDLIFLDIMMPDMDGHQALAEIREREKRMNLLQTGNEVLIVMTTALSDTKNVCKSFFQGYAEAYLTKPIDLNELQTLTTRIFNQGSHQE